MCLHLHTLLHESRGRHQMLQGNENRSTCWRFYFSFLELFTSNKYSPVESSYFIWYFSLSKMLPLTLFHVTSGLGSPITKALKTANFPKGRVGMWSFGFLLSCEQALAAVQSLDSKCDTLRCLAHIETHLLGRWLGLLYIWNLGHFSPLVSSLYSVWWPPREF